MSDNKIIATPDKSVIIETKKDANGKIAEQKQFLHGVLREHKFFADGVPERTMEYGADGMFLSETFHKLPEGAMSKTRYYRDEGRSTVVTAYKDGKVVTEHFEADGSKDVWIDNPDGSSTNEKYNADGVRVAQIQYD